MKVLLIALLSSCVLVVGSIVVAAPEQGQRPGEISPPNVWVQNRGPGEAIPVKLVDAAPVRVQIADPFTGRPDNVVGTRASRQTWDYTQVLIGENDNAVALLNSAGANGWEATGLQFPSKSGTAVVLKRPR
jgi:hypothetical protein